MRSFVSPQRPSSFGAFIRWGGNIHVWGDTNSGSDTMWEQADISYTLTSLSFSGRHFPNSSALQCWKEDAEAESEYKGFYLTLLKLVIYDISLWYTKWLSSLSSSDVREKLSGWILNCITQNKVKWKHENKKINYPNGQLNLTAQEKVYTQFLSSVPLSQCIFLVYFIKCTF